MSDTIARTKNVNLTLKSLKKDQILRRKNLSLQKKLIYSKYKFKRKNSNQKLIKKIQIEKKDLENLKRLKESFTNKFSPNNLVNILSRKANESKVKPAVNDVESLRQIDPIQVSCNNVIGQLFKNKFGSGGKGKCIRVLTDANNQEKWLSPIEFESFSGKGSCRDWKRTIKVGGISLMTLLENDILTCHAISCSCAACNQNNEVIGPIRPMIKYRRRKKDEILAQNAFKKFLSLKPPTILAQKMQKISNVTKIQNKKTEVVSVTRKESQNINNVTSFESVKITESSSLKDLNLNDSLKASISELIQAENNQWNLLEKEATNILNQAQNLQSLVQTARKESETNRQNLINLLKRNKI